MMIFLYILFILFIFVLFFLASVVKIIFNLKSFNRHVNEEETKVSNMGSNRKISSSAGEYVDFDEIKK